MHPNKMLKFKIKKVWPKGHLQRCTCGSDDILNYDLHDPSSYHWRFGYVCKKCHRFQEMDVAQSSIKINQIADDEILKEMPYQKILKKNQDFIKEVVEHAFDRYGYYLSISAYEYDDTGTDFVVRVHYFNGSQIGTYSDKFSDFSYLPEFLDSVYSIIQEKILRDNQQIFREKHTQRMEGDILDSIEESLPHDFLTK